MLNMHEILDVVINTPARNSVGITTTFWGPPGVAKTAIIEEYATGYGLPCQVLSPGELGEGAFGVVPVGTAEHIHYPPPAWTKKFTQADGGIVFIDEITCAPPALQAPLLGLLQKRKIGDYTLPNTVRIIAAGNPADIAANGYELSLPAANRMAHFSINKPSVEQWAHWMGGTFTPNTQKRALIIECLSELFPKQFALNIAVVSGFLKANPALFHAMPKTEQPSNAWPSPRSWEMCTRLLTTAQLVQLDVGEFVSGCVGEDAATQFVAYLSNLDLPDPEQLLGGKIQWKPPIMRQDIIVIVLDACARTVIAEQDKAKQAAYLTALLKIMDGVKLPDLYIEPMKILVPSMRTELYKHPIALRIIDTFGKAKIQLDKNS